MLVTEESGRDILDIEVRAEDKRANVPVQSVGVWATGSSPFIGESRTS